MSDDKIIKPESEWKEQLTPAQYEVLRAKATERPFTGEATSTTKQMAPTPVGPPALGVVSLRSKFEFPAVVGRASGEAADKNSIERWMTPATACSEPKCCAAAVAPLGHLFDDGPQPTGIRYCINSGELALKAQSKDRRPEPRPDQRDVSVILETDTQAEHLAARRSRGQ